MKLFSILFLAAVIASVAAGGCSLFGHSCLGGHGKRAESSKLNWRPIQIGRPFPLMHKSLEARPESAGASEMETLEFPAFDGTVMVQHSRHNDPAVDYTSGGFGPLESGAKK